MKLSHFDFGKHRIASSLIGLTLAVFTFAAVMVFSTNTGSQAATGERTAVAYGTFDELQIQLGPSGFSPSEVQHAAGTFAIAVDNTGVSGEYTLRLTRSDGTVVKEVQVQKGSAAWTTTLSAGEYILTEADHSEWSCRITVQ